MAEIYITTTASLPTSDAPQSQHYHQQHATPMVTQVVYRNNGLPFRVEDWSRLKKIAEGNPDVNKVGELFTRTQILLRLQVLLMHVL